MATTVTIDKIYFETLLRKVNIHGGEPEQNIISVTNEHYDKLTNSAKEYKALCTALIRGGVTIENLKLLINAGIEEEESQGSFNRTQNGHINLQTPPHTEASHSSYNLLSRPHPPSAPSFHTQPSQYTNHSQTRNHRNSHTHYEDIGDDGEGSNGTTKQDIQEHRRIVNECNDKTGKNRTLFFSRLPEKATYASFLEVVRGGAVVDAWMKPGDRCASISFLHPQSAEAFYRYAKKNDLYVDGRRIIVEWREPSRQFVVLPNILRQILSGATRNLYLKNIPPTLTEERLRNDLDHIANLSIEKIFFEKSKNAVQVNLNSVCVACFARTCLKSRAYYKGTKIDFGVDDC